MKYSSWNIKLKYPRNPIKEIVRERMKRSGFVLSPKYESLSDPKTIHDLSKASKILKKAITDGRTIGIFMDYDADGVCAGAILYKAIRMLKGDCEYYVPRRSEGYGLSRKALDDFRKKNVDLVVTVDCGIRNIAEIEYAKKLQLDIIVTDHHLIGEKKPKALATVHPALKNDNTFSQYSGAGIALQLARELLDKDEKTKWFLDLASISTVADVVPLIGENRVIVKYGLIVINKTRNLGLKYLIEKADLSKKEIGTYELGYMIAPRLNAAGRLARPIDSFRLLITQNTDEAKQLSEKLNKYNKIRQKQLSDSMEEALIITKKQELYQNNIILIRGKWNEGIVGLIAGKITQEYHLPSIVLAEVDGKLKGSARSIPKIDITKLISKFRNYLFSYGGHQQAAGLSLKRGRFKSLKNALEKEAKKIDKKIFARELEIDALVKMNDLNLDFARDLQKLSPFGMGNPQVVLCLKRIYVERMRLVGRDNNHLNLLLCSEDKFCKAILFNYNEKVFELEEGQEFDLAFRVMIDSWRGKDKINLHILDAKKS